MLYTFFKEVYTLTTLTITLGLPIGGRLRIFCICKIPNNVTENLQGPVCFCSSVVSDGVVG